MPALDCGSALCFAVMGPTRLQAPNCTAAVAGRDRHLPCMRRHGRRLLPARMRPLRQDSLQLMCQQGPGLCDEKIHQQARVISMY